MLTIVEFARVLRGSIFGVLVSIALLVGCVESPPPEENTAERTPKRITVEFDRRTVLPTSVLSFELKGTARIVPKRARVIFRGEGGSFENLSTYFTGRIERENGVGDLTVRLPVDDALWSELDPNDRDRFEGRIIIELYDEIGVLARGSIDSVQWMFREGLRPAVESPKVGDVYVNQNLVVQGSGFLRPDEGTTVAHIQNGSIERPNAPTMDLSGRRIPLEWSGSREEAQFPIDPGAFGVHKGSFEAVVTFANERRDGVTNSGKGRHEIAGTIQESYVATLEPGAGSRGQKITVRGRGFVPTEDSEGYGMLLRYSGKFVPDREDEEPQNLEGSNAIERPPDRVVAEDTLEQAIWYEVEGRSLTGLGATPGTFEGSITPVLYDKHGSYEGAPWEGTFRVLPTKQVVYLKYLPSFSQALQTYGMRNVEREIRDRVLEVVERDYAAYHVEFREEKPTDFLDYATIELGGPDPTGTRAFGYDNSFNDVAKDTGNLYLADYLGGVNRSAAEEFDNPYGGIFLASFTIFSKELNPDNPYASPAFDRILGPFMPDLGGKPVRGTEWPNGPRVEKIERAIHMVGSAIGNTVTHEIGHSMGMTFVPGDFQRPQNTFHNQAHRAGRYIMDAGSERPFEERAELDDKPPPTFNPGNQQYLDRILPKPQ